MTSYAAQKGRSTTAAQPAAKAAPEPLTAAEDNRIIQNRDFVQEHLRDIVPLFRNLHAEGLIDGWRAITNCRLTQENAS